ncbi:MAG: ribulose-phosphate 3-epimerase [Rickettsiaceae bacterium]|nr:ribulose-phosphate 3-epimerase [Rickettsiaceae bacterium]
MMISPSILCADLLNLESEVKKICASSANYIHLDIMDGHFVPNITFGQGITRAIKKISTMPLDVHLMITNPDAYYNEFIDAGADIITFHLEAARDPKQLIKNIVSKSCKAGISIRPSTNVNLIYPYIKDIDLILIMTVEPGFGGQKFMDSCVEKIAHVSSKARECEKDIIISVDGGINAQTAKLAKNAGASMLVAGSYLFTGDDFNQRVDILRES